MGVVNKNYVEPQGNSGYCGAKTSGNPGSVVAQGPRFPGGVGVVFELPSMGGACIFTGTALSSN